METGVIGQNVINLVDPDSSTDLEKVCLTKTRWELFALQMLNQMTATSKNVVLVHRSVIVAVHVKALYYSIQTKAEVTTKDSGSTEKTAKPQEVTTEIIAQEPLPKFVVDPCHRLSTKTIFFVPPCENANLKPTEDVCRSTQNNVVSDAWCQANCPLRFCPRSYCKCDKYQTLPELSNLPISLSA